MRLKIAVATPVPVFMYWGEFGLVIDFMMAIPRKEKAVQAWKIEVDPIQFSRSEIQDMIDIALSISDHEWFDKLFEKLKKTKEKSK